jgi:hypothetical protein
MAVYLGTMISSTIAGSFTRGCAARDIQVLTLIEQRESDGAVMAQKSTDAIMALLHARMVCHEGHVLDALALYDGIARSLTVQYGQAQ